MRCLHTTTTANHNNRPVIILLFKRLRKPPLDIDIIILILHNKNPLL